MLKNLADSGGSTPGDTLRLSNKIDAQAQTDLDSNSTHYNHQKAEMEI